MIGDGSERDARIYGDGWDACMRGEDVRTNPYERGSPDWRAWWYGYFAALPEVYGYGQAE